MYESPITLIREQTNRWIKEVYENTDEVIYKAVLAVLPQVDKEELIKALAYDRGQYTKGYEDRDAEIVRCKDCRWWNGNPETMHNNHLCRNWSKFGSIDTSADGFCSYGERREDGKISNT